MKLLRTWLAVLALAAFSIILGVYAGNALAVLHVKLFATGSVENLAYIYGLLSTVTTFGGCLKVIYDTYE